MTPLSRPTPLLGVYDRPYWDFIGTDELRLQQCADCGAFRYPPGPRCAHCLSPNAEWIRLNGRGHVLGWTVFHRQYFPDLPVPYTVVSVRTAEGPLLIGNLVHAGPGKPEIGMAVRTIFETAAGPDGDWRICQWEPDPDGTRDPRYPQGKFQRRAE